MNVLEEFKIILRNLENSNEYYKKGVPRTMSKVDVELNRIMSGCKLLSEEDIETLRKDISTDIGWLLLSFSENMATYSLRSSKQEFLTNGLLALCLIFDTIDWREIILIMSLFYDVHKRIGLSFKEIIHSEDKFKIFVEEFLSREENNKTLESMGYILTKDESDNLIYQRTW